MTKTEIAERVAQGEDSRTQFKRGPIGIAKLAAELVAFSNASGGSILFGVDDDGTVVGLASKDKKILTDEISNAANDNVRPAIYPQTEYHTVKGKQILCVTVAEGALKPYFDNRVELTSPGSLPNHLTIEMMKSGVSVARNPLIFTFATKEIPYRGLGSGIKRVTEITKHVEFISDSEANFFTAKIYRQEHAPIKPPDTPIKPADAPIKPPNAPIKPPNAPIKPANAPIKPADAQIKPPNAPIKGRAEPVSDTEATRISEIIRNNPGINKTKLSRISGIAAWTIKRILEGSLRTKIEFRGAKKTGGYYIVAESQTQRTKAKKRKP